MKRNIFAALTISFLTLAGCGGKDNVGEKDGNKYKVVGPEIILEVNQGDKNEQFTVSINRKNWKAPIEVEVKEVPEGLTVTDLQGKSKWTSKGDDNERIFKIEVDGNAKLHDSAVIVFEANSDGTPAIERVKVKVIESLKNKMVKKKAFTKEQAKKIKSFQKTIDKLTTEIPTVADTDVKSQLLKRLGEVTNDYEQAQKAFDKLKEAQAKNWEQYRSGVASRVESLESELTSLQKKLEGAERKKSK